MIVRLVNKSVDGGRRVNYRQSGGLNQEANMQSRVVILPLFRGYRAVSDAGAATDTIVQLNVPKFGDLLPQAEALTLHYMTKGRTSAFEWSIFLVPGFDRDNEASAVNLNGGTYITSSVPARVDYSTTANFLLDGRLELWFRGSAAGVQSALISAALAVRTYGS